MNNTGVTPLALQSAKAMHKAARDAHRTLQDVYQDAPDDRSKARIAALHQQVNFGLKSAEVSALIGIGEAIVLAIKADQQANRPEVLG